jgi:hypothetical protein
VIFRQLDAKTKSSFSPLLIGLLLCQMFVWPITALGAENEALADATVEIERGWSDHPHSVASGDVVLPTENPALLAISDFTTCDPKFDSFGDHAFNYLQPDPVDAHKCVAGIGANHHTYGKLMTHRFPVSQDVWISGYVYFPAGFQLPAVSAGSNGMCDGGVHLWRLHQSLISSTNRISMDFNVPAGMDVIQFMVVRDNGSKNFVKWTSYKPVKLKGQWQYWQVHLNLGTPGKSDGFLRFYASHKLVDSMENQPFLPAGADATWGFSYADLQSNIGGCSAQWPIQNGWLVSSVRVCKNDVC